MQNTSALYRRILEDENHWFEAGVVIGESGNLITEQNERILFGGVSIIVARSGPDSGYLENRLIRVRTASDMFKGRPEIGRAVAQEIEVQMFNPAGEFPPMSVVVPYVRACTEQEQSEWLQQGVFYIDTRSITHNSNGLDILTLHGFDAMLTSERDYADTALDWPAADTDVVAEIAGTMGVEVDPRTWNVMTDGYTLPLPAGYSLREMLEYIAMMYLGCFIMTETGQLRLVTLTELPPETNYLVDSFSNSLVFGEDRILV